MIRARRGEGKLGYLLLVALTLLGNLALEQGAHL